MRRKRQGGVSGFGELAVVILIIAGGGLLWSYWTVMPEWLRVLLLMAWIALLLFWPVIVSAIDSK